MRSGSFAAIGCSNSTATTSLDTGAVQVLTVAGSGLVLTVNGCGMTNAPLTRWPGFAVSGSLTVSAASPAVEVTVAVVCAL